MDYEVNDTVDTLHVGACDIDDYERDTTPKDVINTL